MKKKRISRYSLIALMSLIAIVIFPAQSFAQHHKRKTVVVYKQKQKPKYVKRVVHRTNPTYVVYRNTEYRIQNGRYFVKEANRYIEVMPPIGMRVPAIPAHRSMIVTRHKTYFTCQGIYYKPHPRGGFVVIRPPKRVR